jgi:hypothetical protein
MKHSLKNQVACAHKLVMWRNQTADEILSGALVLMNRRFLRIYLLNIDFSSLSDCLGFDNRQRCLILGAPKVISHLDNIVTLDFPTSFVLL